MKNSSRAILHEMRINASRKITYIVARLLEAASRRYSFVVDATISLLVKAKD